MQLTLIPNYKTKFGRVYFGDCVKILRNLEIESQCGLCFTDPPYFSVKLAKGKHREPESKSIEPINYPCLPEAEYYELMKNWYTEIKRICKIIVFTPGHQALAWWLTKFPGEFDMMIWYNNARLGCSKVAQFCVHEPILTHGLGGKGSIKYERSVIEIPANPKEMKENSSWMEHPCPKSSAFWEALLIPILRQVPHATVIDPFLGSGATAQICEKFRVPWIGCDIEPRYLPTIERRIKNGQSKPASLHARDLDITQMLKK
jgi:hypothetical protein